MLSDQAPERPHAGIVLDSMQIRAVASALRVPATAVSITRSCS